MSDKFKALIIEDDNATSEIIKALLDRRGFETVQCKNGAVGLYYYLKEHFHVVTLDLMMPEVDGEIFLRVVESLYDEGLLTDTGNVIIESAVENYQHLSRLSKLKCVHAVFSKPIEKDQLINAVARLCPGAF